MATAKEIREKQKEEARKRARLRSMGSMEERQAKKTAVKGTMQGKQVDTTKGPNMSTVNKSDGTKATKATTKTPIVTKEQLKASGFTNLRDYLNNKKGLTRRDGKAPERTNNKPESTTKSQDAKPESTTKSQDAKPNKSNAPKPDYSNKAKTEAKTSMVDKFKSLVGANREPTAKEAMGRNQMNAARKSMGMKHGGKVKPGMHKMPDGTMMKDSDHKKKMAYGGKVKKMKSGGMVKRDGCAVRGKTRGRMV